MTPQCVYTIQFPPHRLVASTLCTFAHASSVRLGFLGDTVLPICPLPVPIYPPSPIYPCVRRCSMARATFCSPFAPPFCAHVAHLSAASLPACAECPFTFTQCMTVRLSITAWISRRHTAIVVAFLILLAWRRGCVHRPAFEQWKGAGELAGSVRGFARALWGGRSRVFRPRRILRECVSTPLSIPNRSTDIASAAAASRGAAQNQAHRMTL